MKQAFILRVPFLILLFILPSQFLKAQQYMLSDNNQHFIGDYFRFIEDKKNQFSVSDIQQQLFVKQYSNRKNFGFTSSTFWFKTKLFNNTSENNLVLGIANGTIDSAILYKENTDGTIISIPEISKQYNSATRIFHINIATGDSAVYYFEVKSTKPLIVPIYISGREAAVQNVVLNNTLFGIYIGIVLVMFFYNLFIFFTTRDKNYFYYIIYILFLVFTQISLQGYLRLFGASSYLTRISVPLAIASIGFISSFFIRSFLNLKENMRWFYNAIYGFNAIYILAVLLSLLNVLIPAQIIVQCNTFLGSFITLYAGIKIQRKGFKPAFFFNISWSFFLMSVIVFILKDEGIFPVNAFTNNAILFGSSIETALLSFALADKINTLRKEKEISQAQTLQAFAENERIIKEQNQMLETKVTERTIELKETNSQLNTTLAELKDAQTQLVESEKMASLGQLTAGIAHEINNPINFVTSNVTPLQRDIQLLNETFSRLEELVVADISSEEKQKQINTIKEAVEYDYLKEEISFLLKGIHEGSHRTAEIVKGLRIFSRVDEDDLKKVNIHEGIDATLVIINTLLHNHIKIVKDYGPLPMIDCYPGKLNQVFLNILTNAVYAVDKKGNKHEGEVVIKTILNGEYVFIEISDNGIGMDEKTTQHIFEPFFTTKDVGEGTGLGLSIVYNIIRKHNGSITVKSVPGEGSKFIIQLPVNNIS